MPEVAAEVAATIARGLASVVELTREPALATGGETILRSVSGAVAAELDPREDIVIALPCIQMADKKPSLLVVLEDRAILAWSTGVLRSTPHSDVVPLAESWGATIAPGIGSRQPVKVLTVQWAERDPWVVAVPDYPQLTGRLRELFRARSSTM